MDPLAIFTALLGPDGMADPYPLYAALQEHGEVIAAGPGFVLVPGYRAANTVLRDADYRVEDAESLDRASPGWREHPSLSADGLLNLNGQEHARLRGLMIRQFTHRRVQALEPAIARLTDSLLGKLADGGAGGQPVDFMQDFAFALPVAVICELIGVPDWDLGQLRPLARSLTAILEPLADQGMLVQADAAAVTLGEMFDELTAERRASPRDDLVSELVAAADSPGTRIGQRELVENLILLLVAGFETTTNLLGNGLQIALSDPAAGDDLRSGAVPPAAFVEEVLRFDSPVQQTGRRRRGSGELAGVEVGGEQLIVMLEAANRDPRRFTEPDSFRPGRPDGGPLSFGAGAHFCLGAALARLEGTVAFPRLLRRFPGLAAAGQPERRAGMTFRGFERLPVSLG